MKLVCVADKLFSRKCLAIISFLATHAHTRTHRLPDCTDTGGKRLCVSDGGESSNSALSFSPLLSCGDLKEVSDWEKFSVVSSFLINSHIQLSSFSSTSPLSPPAQRRFRGSVNWRSHKSFPGFIVRKQRVPHSVSSASSICPASHNTDQPLWRTEGLN